MCNIISCLAGIVTHAVNGCLGLHSSSLTCDSSSFGFGYNEFGNFAASKTKQTKKWCLRREDMAVQSPMCWMQICRSGFYFYWESLTKLSKPGDIVLCHTFDSFSTVLLFFHVKYIWLNRLYLKCLILHHWNKPHCYWTWFLFGFKWNFLKREKKKIWYFKIYFQSGTTIESKLLDSPSYKMSPF